MLVTITRVINWSILFTFIACFAYQIIYLIAPYIKKEQPPQTITASSLCSTDRSQK